MEEILELWKSTNSSYPGPERFIEPDQVILRSCNLVLDFSLNCIWINETYVSSNGISNRYNSYSWAQQYLNFIVEQSSQGRFEFNVWAGILG